MSDKHELTELEERFTAALDRLFIEDEYGRRYSVVRAYAIGTKTNDPGFVIRIRDES